MYALEVAGITIGIWASFGLLNLLILAITCWAMYGTAAVMFEDKFFMWIAGLCGPIATILMVIAFLMA